MIESRRILGRRQDLWGGTFITIARRQLSHQLPRFLSSSTPPPDSNLHLCKRNSFSFPSVYSRQAELLFFEASKRYFLFPHLDVSSCPSADASSDWHTPRVFPHRPDRLLFALEDTPCFERLLPCGGSPGLQLRKSPSALHPAISGCLLPRLPLRHRKTLQPASHELRTN